MKNTIFPILFLIIVFLHLYSSSCAQTYQLTQKSDMPFAISNNAVTHGYSNGVPYLFSFAGIDNTKIFSGISLQSFAYNINDDSWSILPDLPDTLGKIAASASTVNNRIYIIGGYHVLANGTEITNNKVHVFDPETFSFLADGQSVPVPIDDQVQCVWRDSIIFCVSGWSNSGNVANVQLYNPALDTWQVGTSVPNNNTYKCFGGSGTIVGDTIYYYGGATGGFNFPAVNFLRKGVINSADPTSITWSNPINFIGNTGYRTAAITDNFNFVYFIGGSAKSYNYNGLAYSNNLGVEPNTTIINLSPSTMNWQADVVANLPMDLRGIAQLNNGTCYLAGGMESNQQVSNKTWELSIVNTTHIEDFDNTQLRIFPNPTNGILHLNLSMDPNLLNPIKAQIHSNLGVLIKEIEIIQQEEIITLNDLPPGIYYIRIISSKEIKNMIFILLQ